MPAIVVIGGQWGDEGKGRIVDLLARRASVVARYSAGNNAGHTVINELGEFKLNLIPAGIFHPGKTCVIGNGVVVDPGRLLQEIQHLESRGVSVKNLHVSDRAHVLMPYHRVIDLKDEELRAAAGGEIGTTGRGVGPAFTDKVARIGIRMAELVDTEWFARRLQYVLEYKNAVLTKLYDADPVDYQAVFNEYADYGRQLAPFVRDTSLIVQDALARGERVLLEGAQGAMLDLDFGTYEYVTSSVPSSVAAGAAIGIGIGPTEIERVVGVYKAYCTRVGNGPFPTEQFGEVAARLAGGLRPEVGTTTGRPRRCGWFDAVAARYTARLNGVHAAVLTRLDVLDQFSSIKVCTGYQVNGDFLESFPANPSVLARCTPVYEELSGWETPTSHARRFEDLPPRAQGYVRRIEELIGVPVDLVSVGPERDQAIVVNPIM